MIGAPSPHNVLYKRQQHADETSLDTVVRRLQKHGSATSNRRLQPGGTRDHEKRDLARNLGALATAGQDVCSRSGSHKIRVGKQQEKQGELCDRDGRLLY